MLPEGLSPRGRGNLGARTERLDPLGSIPAWAGEPDTWIPTQGYPAVYPRVGGGTAFVSALEDFCDGLSPRGRGNLRSTSPFFVTGGSIPAWAGEPSS